MDSLVIREWYDSMDEKAQERLAKLLIGIQGDRTLRRFALDIGVKPGTLRKWVDRESLPTPVYLRLIAEVAGLSMDKLYAYLAGELEVGFDSIPKNKPVSPETVVEMASRWPKDEVLRAIQLLAEVAKNK